MNTTEQYVKNWLDRHRAWSATEETMSDEERHFEQILIDIVTGRGRQIVQNACDTSADVLAPYEFDKTDEINKIVKEFKHNLTR